MKTDIVLLAAGNSSRFGRENKLLTEVNGKPMFLWALELLQQAAAELEELLGTIIVVSKYREIEEAAGRYPDFVYQENLHSERGISESIHIGVETADPAHAILFFVCDQPDLKADTLCELIRQFSDAERSAGAVADYAGEIGNPCIFAPKLREELLSLTGDTGGKKIIRKLPKTDCIFVEVQPEELRDIDYCIQK